MQCRICGEEKTKEEFATVHKFRKYKKQKVQWCNECQKLWIEFRKEKDYSEKYLSNPIFTVSFE